MKITHYIGRKAHCASGYRPITSYAGKIFGMDAAGNAAGYYCPLLVDLDSTPLMGRKLYDLVSRLWARLLPCLVL